jgi:chorismate-pyruvate lyase
MKRPRGHPLHLSPDPAELFAQFPPADDVPQYQVLVPGEVPPPYDGLLVHEYHMTVTLEAYHGDLVDVHPLAVLQRGDVYTRKIVLTLRGSGKVVLFGIVRVNLAELAPLVRDEIVAQKAPFGRVLIKHNVMRRIEPTGFFRIEPGPKQVAWFGLAELKPLYGRVAFIRCDGRRAVELFEVVAPE